MAEQLTEVTLVWLAELNATIRADERAKTAEDIARAIEAHAEQGWVGGCVDGMHMAAAIARQHANGMPSESCDPTAATLTNSTPMLCADCGKRHKVQARTERVEPAAPQSLEESR